MLLPLSFFISAFCFPLSAAHPCSSEPPKVKDLTFAAWIPSPCCTTLIFHGSNDWRNPITASLSAAAH